MAKEGSLHVYLWDNEEGARFILQMENDVRKSIIDGMVGRYLCVNLLAGGEYYYDHRFIRKIIKRGTKIL
jgi:hypothetical protein